MNKVKTARAIIETEYKSNKYIITIKRTKYKDGKIVNEYYTLPGGHVEENETYEDAVIREVFEELNIKVSIKNKLLSSYNNDLDRYEDFYICNIVSGIISKGSGPEWTNPDVEKYGSYEIVYIDIHDISNYNILPTNVKEELIKRYNI